MSANQHFHYAGWSAFVNAPCGVIGFVSLVTFFPAGQPFGMIHDGSSVFFALSLIPLETACKGTYAALARRRSMRRLMAAWIIASPVSGSRS